MSAVMDKTRLMQVLLAPQVSEKSTFVGEKNNQYVFRVAADATKPEIKAAVRVDVQDQGEVGPGHQRQGQGQALRALRRAPPQTGKKPTSRCCRGPTEKSRKSPFRLRSRPCRS